MNKQKRKEERIKQCYCPVFLSLHFFESYSTIKKDYFPLHYSKNLSAESFSSVFKT